MKFPSVIPSVNPLVIKKYYYRGIYRRNEAGNFFYFRRIKNYRWRIHRRSIFVGDVVGKLITDGICVLHWRRNSIDKTVKSCSGCFFFLCFCFLNVSSSVSHSAGLLSMTRRTVAAVVGGAAFNGKEREAGERDYYSSLLLCYLFFFRPCIMFFFLSAGGGGSDWDCRRWLGNQVAAAVMVVLRRFFSVLCPSLCISLSFASSFVSQVLLLTTGRTVAAGGGVAVLLLLLRKDIGPCVFFFVVFFCFPSLFCSVSSLSVTALLLSSSIFGRWWCCRGWLGGTVEAMVAAMRTTEGGSSSHLLCSVSLFSVFKCSPSFLFSKPSPPLFSVLPPCIYR